jgi:hypothetical protein
MISIAVMVRRFSLSDSARCEPALISENGVWCFLLGFGFVLSVPFDVIVQLEY